MDGKHATKIEMLARFGQSKTEAVLSSLVRRTNKLMHDSTDISSKRIVAQKSLFE